MGQAARPLLPAALARLAVSVLTASVFQFFVFLPLFVACCFVFFFYFGASCCQVQRNFALSECGILSEALRVCVCVWHGAIAHYANYLHEFSILVKRFGALLGHKGEKLGISRNMIKMTFDGDDERNLNPAQIDLSEAN